ncbi:NADPH-dependent FMN reductase [Planktotalea sp.]|uniref:NADPH-dependent FMN reductase n=1 Tax=Planktotalea sp. TaxID=2029877 RepID=UPI003F6B8D47
MASPKVLGISGSLRSGSFNTKLLNVAITSFGDAEANVADINFPLYDGDIEAQGIPDAVQAFAAQVADADAVIISSPEYNKGISGALKNALDWVSRVEGNVFRGKPTLVIGAAAGRTGGETAYFMTRHCLTPLGATVLATPAVLVAGAFGEFNDDGALKSEQYQASLDAAVKVLRSVAG